MAFVVIAEPPDAFKQWAAQQSADAIAATGAEARAGEQAFVNGSCAGCHSVRGTAAVGVLGPDLTHIGSRQTLAALTLPNTTEGMTKWLSNTQGVKPGAHMPQVDLTSDEITTLVAYLEGLR
jgi:cytochrome c oxidase subunit 2